MRLPTSRCHNTETRIAQSRDEWIRAYELVYRCYVAKGYVQPGKAGLVFRDAFALPDSRTWVAGPPDEAIFGTMTLVGDNPRGLEIEETFAQEIADLRRQGLRFLEVTALAAEARDDLPVATIVFSLMREAFLYAEQQGYDASVMIVHPRHVPFYRRWFAAAALGPARPHGPACNHPGVGCCIDIPRARRHIEARARGDFLARPFSPEQFARSGMSDADRLYFQLRMRWGGSPIVLESGGGV